MQVTINELTRNVLLVFKPVMSVGALNKLAPEVQEVIKNTLGGREVIDLAKPGERPPLVVGATHIPQGAAIQKGGK